MIEFVLMKAKVKFIPSYRCECGKQQAGEVVTKEFIGMTSESLKEFIDSWNLDSTHMPVGWTYTGKFLCRNCVKNLTGASQ